MKIGYEFDFLREAEAMERIRDFLDSNNKKSPVIVPRVIGGMVTRYDFQMMEFSANYLLIQIKKKKLFLVSLICLEIVTSSYIFILLGRS